jgi:Secretion system C-terminal sorting domain
MKKLIVSLYVFGAGISAAQSLSHSVVATAGAHSSTVAASLDWTLGEIATETYQKGSALFTQGFQQPSPAPKDQRKDMLVYPNPVPDYLFIRTIENGEYRIEFFNLHGQRLLAINSTANSANAIFIHQLDVRGFEAALYLLRVHNISTGKKSFLKVVKI